MNSSQFCKSSLCEEYDFITNKVFWFASFVGPSIFTVLFKKHDDDACF